MIRISASSLLETLVALLLVSMVIVATSTIIVNVSQSNATYQKTKWHAWSQSWLNESISNGEFTNEEREIENVMLSRVFTNYNGDSELKIVSIYVLKEDVVVYSVKKVLAP